MEFFEGHTASASLLLLLLQAFYPVSTQLYDDGQQLDCMTPKSAAGKCVELRTCAELMQLLSTLNMTDDDSLRQSSCRQDPWVCCLIRSSISAENSSRLIWNLSSNQNLPQRCGDDFRGLFGGEKTRPSEFPWLTLLEYTKPQGKITACGGVLISKRYVLTAAHCVREEDLPRGWRLSNVRLGEHDLSKERNCERTGEEPDDYFCFDDPVSVGIEEQIVHEDYRSQSQDRANDIAILRLARDVIFTDSVRPICLPSSDKTVDHYFRIAGWGKTKTSSESTVQSTGKVSLADFETCANTYQQSRKLLSDEHLCIGSQRPRDLCYGDSGGPLMAYERIADGRIHWVIYGIDFFGHLPCGMENWPRVYTKVTKYVPWILSKIRA